MDHQLFEGYNQLHYEKHEGSHVDHDLKVLYELTGQEPALSIDTDKAWDRFAEQINPAGIERSMRPSFWLRAAAVILLGSFLGIASYFYLESPTPNVNIVTIQNAGSAVKSHLLPDGSIVWMRQGTTLSYNEGFEGRSLTFAGEAYFDIEKGQGTFTISMTDGLDVVVLGTEFAINTTTSNPVVHVTEGTVALETTDAQQQISAGESAVYYRAQKRILKSTEDPTNALSWKTGHFKFDDLPLTEAIVLLESFYPTKILLRNPAIGKCRVTGEFKDQALKDILEDLSMVLSIEVEVADNSFILSGEGC